MTRNGELVGHATTSIAVIRPEAARQIQH